MKIRNKPLFWTGLSFQIVQILAIGTFALTLLDWSWFTFKILLFILIGAAVLFYNGLSFALIFLGLEFKCKKKK